MSNESLEYAISYNGGTGGVTYPTRREAEDALSILIKRWGWDLAKAKIVSRTAYTGQQGPPPAWK